LIELACDALHGGVIESLTIGHDGERVAVERSLCEGHKMSPSLHLSWGGGVDEPLGRAIYSSQIVGVTNDPS
jgi:hypothetical protein